MLQENYPNKFQNKAPVYAAEKKLRKMRICRNVTTSYSTI